MSEKKILLLHKIIKLILSASIIIAGACLIFGCLSIYYSGEQPFSREAVGLTFDKIDIPVYICLALTVVSILLNIFSPSAEATLKNKPSKELLLSLLSSKRELSVADQSVVAAVKAEEKRRRLINIIQAAVILLSSAVFLAYALNPANFHTSEINASMVKAMWVLIPCLAVSLAVSLAAFFLKEKSFGRQTEIIKTLPKAQNEDSVSVKRAVNKTAVARWTLLAIGLVLFIYGYFSGGIADVLTKAINICTECIGLG